MSENRCQDKLFVETFILYFKFKHLHQQFAVTIRSYFLRIHNKPAVVLLSFARKNKNSTFPLCLLYLSTPSSLQFLFPVTE